MTPARVTLVTLGVDDVARSCRFYAALGWEKAPQGDAATAFLEGDGIVLSLWRRDEMAADGGEGDLPAGSGSVALAVNFASEPEVGEAYERAVAAGAEPVKPPARAFWGGFSGNFRDPDGHLWEFAHNPFFALDARGRLDLDQEPAA
jgi:uncharacterized protein